MTTRDRPIQLTVSLFATCFAVSLAVLVPAAYFFVSYEYMRGSLDVQAEMSASTISGLVMSNPATWRFEEVRMMELLERRPRSGILETRRVLDAGGSVVAESANRLAAPILSRRHEIFDAGTKVAEIEISRSLLPLLGRTGAAGVGSSLFGILLFFALRILPLRAIRRAHHAVDESERKYRSLFLSMREGMVLHHIRKDPDSTLLHLPLADINPAAESLLGGERDSVTGRDARELYGEEMAQRLAEICRSPAPDEDATFEFVLPGTSRYYTVSAFFPDGEMCAILLEDITERKRADAQIQKLAYYDMLTGLPNRSLLSDRLGNALARASREGARLALLFLDLDRFKYVNDTLGHAAGDSLLKQVAERLQATLRRSDTVARLGGDEFIILLASAEEVSAAHAAQHLLDSLAPAYAVGDREVFASASVGIAMFPEDGDDADTLLRCADMAMYAAKEAGRNGYHFYSREMDVRTHELMDLEMSLRQAVEREEFFLEFQPIISASGTNCIGAEALVRWRHPTRGVVSPGVFIPVAEESGSIIPLGNWVLRNACSTIKKWLAAGLTPVRVAVNISGRQFAQPDFAAIVAETIAASGIDPSLLELELTETTLMEGVQTVENLRNLKRLGVAITIDDFGSGYSSLSYLKRFPIDRLKIDRSFIWDLATDREDRAIVEAVIAMGGKLGIDIVAEGVETPEQAAFLASRGCHGIQGFYYHPPLPEHRVAALLQELHPSRTPGQELPALHTQQAVEESRLFKNSQIVAPAESPTEA